MQEAADLLVKAQQSEDSLFSTMQPTAPSSRALQQLPPKILFRSQTSVSLTNFQQFAVKGNNVPAKFAVYCKATGAGVQLSINRTTMEYPGEN